MVIEGVSYENITLFPVVADGTIDTSDFLTLDAALETGAASITEVGSEGANRSRLGDIVFGRTPPDSPSVSRLALVNRSQKWLILLAGEVVAGGKQDRVISKDRIVPPGADPLPLDVFCVERGRWSSGASFGAARMMAHPSVRERAAVDQKQADVWAAVARGSTLEVNPTAPPPPLNRAMLGRVASRAAPTGAYRGIYESREVDDQAKRVGSELDKAFRRLSDTLKGQAVVGAIVAYGSQPVWTDVFASPELFGRYWPKLLKSYVVEGLARSVEKQRPSLEAAGQFLEPLRGPEIVEGEPDAYRRRHVTVDDFADIELHSVSPKSMLIHRLKIQRTPGSN